jgi:hypothetical protein
VYRLNTARLVFAPKDDVSSLVDLIKETKSGEEEEALGCGRPAPCQLGSNLSTILSAGIGVALSEVRRGPVRRPPSRRIALTLAPETFLNCR